MFDLYSFRLDLPAVRGVLSPASLSAIDGYNYKPSFPALFSRNKLPSRMYRRTICTDLWPVCLMIERSDAPAIAAVVACPARNE